MKPGLWQTMFRSSRLRCPECGEGKFAKSWRETHEECPHCGFDFRVEDGFYLGSIYLNYGLLAVASLAVGLPVVWLGYVTAWTATIIGVVVCISVSVWFFRYARSLWLGLGYFIDHTVRAGSTAMSDSESLDRRQTYLESSQKSIEGICYFCHEQFQFVESRLASWVACPFCAEQILLTHIQITCKSHSC